MADKLNLIFDQNKLQAQRRRALRAFKIKTTDKNPDFLLQWAARDFDERLSVVTREFNSPIELMGHTGFVAKTLQASDKLSAFTRLETLPELLELTPDIGGKVVNSANLFHKIDRTDLIVSPFFLHTVNDLALVLTQIRQVLISDGLFLACLPGEGTLQELRSCLLAAETELLGGAGMRVFPFVQLQDMGTLLQRAGFTLPVLDSEKLIVRYDRLQDLLMDIRAMGMGNCMRGKSRPLTKAVLKKVSDIYSDQFSDPDGRIRATFNMICLSAWTPHESQQKPLAPGSAKINLSDILGSKKLSR